MLLVVSSSLVTASVLPRQRRAGGAGLAGAPPATPDARRAPCGIRPGLRARREYLAARRQLARTLEARIDRLPRSARQKVEANLAELHRAANEINVALALQPGDPLLEELLLNTYQDELAVLASVNQLATRNGTVVPEDEGIKL